MLKHIIDFYKVSAPAPCNGDFLPEQKQRLKRLQWSTFLAATLGYSMYYVCRLSLNVVKKPIVDEGIFSETELGIIGSVLFFTYAIGKFSNGFLADRSNINRFMSTGLLVTALINLCLGSAPCGCRVPADLVPRYPLLLVRNGPPLISVQRNLSCPYRKPITRQGAPGY